MNPNSETTLLIEFLTQLPNISMNAVSLLMLWVVWQEMKRFISFMMDLITKQNNRIDAIAQATGADEQHEHHHTRRYTVHPYSAPTSGGEDDDVSGESHDTKIVPRRPRM